MDPRVTTILKGSDEEVRDFFEQKSKFGLLSWIMLLVSELRTK